MLISSKGRYALRLAVCIAQAGPEAKVSLREVAEHEELSLKYLEQIARPMVSAGLLASVRGKGGGYRLARDPQSHRQLRRVEVLGVLAIVLSEASNWLRLH